jgi:uncharacterized MnhB-related membrane protein
LLYAVDVALAVTLLGLLLLLLLLLLLQRSTVVLHFLNGH